MNCESELVKKIIENQWKQGALIQIENDIRSDLREGLYIVISQSCDICHFSFENEPSVEILTCELVTRADGNLTYGKNPRKIQFLLSDDKYYEAHMKNKRSIDRKLLAQILPNRHLSLSQKSLDNIVRWLTKRYSRDAFPFKFDERLNHKSRNKIKNLLEENGENIIGIFIRLDTEDELTTEHEYKIDLLILVNDNEASASSELVDFLEKIYDALSENKGINVLEDYRIKNINTISLGEFLNFKQLDFDYLSFKYFPEGKLV